MRLVCVILLFICSNIYCQSQFETIGSINGVTLERYKNTYSLIYKNTFTNQYASLNFTDENDKLEVLYKYLLLTLTDKPKEGYMLQFEDDTLLILYYANTVEVLIYVNHNPANIKLTRRLTADEIIKLFGKYDVVRI